MRVDLHNHTTFCNHANGSMEAYITKAINEGIDVFGFAEHAPMNFDEKYRLKLEDKVLYEKSVLQLQEKYQQQINVLLAYEVDFLHGLVLDEIIESKVDYLIGSVHFIQKQNNLWGFDNPEFIGGYESRDIDKIWQDYFDAIEAMAKSQLFQIVGHLDLIKIFKFLPQKDVRTIAKRALSAIKKSHMCIEINAAGIRKPIGEPYPSKALLEEAYALDIPITFSSDAHDIDQVGFGYEKAVILAREVGYTQCATFKNKQMELVNF
jgi:histidinol-phosphatase (PHP family)